MTPDGYLYLAQAALSCMAHIAAFYGEDADTPPSNFGLGLSVILEYIETNVTNAYNKLTEKDKEDAQ